MSPVEAIQRLFSTETNVDEMVFFIAATTRTPNLVSQEDKGSAPC
jgi:hypothetical protein